jgi:hypothetical protein
MSKFESSSSGLVTNLTWRKECNDASIGDWALQFAVPSLIVLLLQDKKYTVSAVEYSS